MNELLYILLISPHKPNIKVYHWNFHNQIPGPIEGLNIQTTL